MTETTTAKQFFERDVPALLAGVNGSSPVTEIIKFDIEDDGTWLVDFAEKQVTELGDGDAPKVSATIRAMERDFLALVDGRMSAADGLLSKRLHLAGDVAVLTRLVGMLATEPVPGL